MHIILRLVCEKLSWIAVKISFLWGPKHGVYAASYFSAIVTSWYLHKDTQNYTSVILYMNIILLTQWLFSAYFDILHCSDVFPRRQKLCKPETIFMQTRVYFLASRDECPGSLCHSPTVRVGVGVRVGVCAWTKTLTLAITFLPEVMGLSDCTCVFLVTRPFTWYHNFWPRDLDLEVWPTFEKL